MDLNLSRWLSQALIASSLVGSLADPALAQDSEPSEAPARFEFREDGAGIPLTADDAAARAVAASPNLERARASVVVAEAGASLSWSSFAPHVELSARYTRVGGFEDGTVQIGGSGLDPAEARMLVDSVVDPAAQRLLSGLLEQQLGEVTFPIPRNQAGLRAQVVVPITDWFATVLPSVRAARARVAAEEHAATALEADVELAAREAFYRHMQAKAALAVAQASALQAREHEERVGAMERAGLATEADQLTAAAHLAAMQAAVTRARGGVDITSAALESLLQVDAPDGFIIRESLDAAPPAAEVDRAVLIERALRRRPELLAMGSAMQAQRHHVRATEGGRYPSLSLLAGYDYAQPNPLVVPPQQRFDGSWRVGVALTWSPDGAVRSHYRAEQLEAELSRTRTEREILRSRIRTEVIDAHARYEAARETLLAVESARRAAESRYEARVAEHRAGEAVTTEVIDADIQVARSRLSEVDAAVEARIARYRLERAVGESVR